MPRQRDAVQRTRGLFGQNQGIATPILGREAGRLDLQAGSFQSSHSHIARPMTSSLSFADSQGNSLVKRDIHWRQGQGMRVMSVPQNVRLGPKASKIWWM